MKVTQFYIGFAVLMVLGIFTLVAGDIKGPATAALAYGSIALGGVGLVAVGGFDMWRKQRK